MTLTRRFALFSMVLAGCGGATPSADAGGTDVTSGGDRPVLVGHWRSDCVPTDTGALTLDFTIETAHWSLDYDTYGDGACAAPFLTVHVAGSYALIAPSPSIPSAWNARFGFDEKTVTPHGAAAVGFLSGLGDACGGSGAWSDGAARDVFASGCAMLGQYPSSICTADYDVVSIDGSGSLHFGQRPADNDMCTEAKRPTVLSPLGVHRVST
jgi:hypothetical protein